MNFCTWPQSSGVERWFARETDILGSTAVNAGRPFFLFLFSFSNPNPFPQLKLSSTAADMTLQLFILQPEKYPDKKDVQIVEAIRFALHSPEYRGQRKSSHKPSETNKISFA